MSLFVLADTHLSLSTDKPMDIFGDRWERHDEKIAENWRQVVKETDTVVINGDISWGMTLDEALPDFRFLQSLPGNKILSKGNHDYWWQTQSKLEQFRISNRLDSISFLHNNAFVCDRFRICGTRGWFSDSAAPQGTDYQKIVNREVGRLRLSFASLPDGEYDETVVFLHFPPVWGEYVCREIVDELHAHGIRRCFFGHMHGQYKVPAHREFEGIDFCLVSSDYLHFLPYRVAHIEMET